jgi:hypothetical protein
MAAGFLSQPGSKYGPCQPTCEHKDCALTRMMAETLCTICDQPIGYDTDFYRAGDGTNPNRLDHALCAELQVEAEQRCQNSSLRRS